MARIIFIILLFLFLPFSSSGQAGNNYASASRLSEGKWFKIAVTEDGIYKIDFNTLKRIGLDNPSCPRLFGNNCGQLSYYNDNTGPDDLNEIAVSLQKGSDGIFNEGDYMLFYAESPHKWHYDPSAGEYIFLRHNYSDTSFYFISSSATPGKSIESAVEPGGQANYFSSLSDALYIHENESVNLLKSGREWYEPVSSTNELTINPGFSGIDTSEPVKFSARVLARASGQTVFRFYEGGSSIESITVSGVDINSTTGTFAKIEEAVWESVPLSASPVFGLRFNNNGDISAGGWIDYLMIRARKKNIFSGTAAFFTDSRSASAGNITAFSIESSIDNALVWDITDPFNPANIKIEKSGNKISFRAHTDSLKKYVTFTSSAAKTPLISSRPVPNQNLHASTYCDMIIVTHPLFSKYAYKLSEIHRFKNGLETLVVTPGEIYNEFSGGIPDIAAIRNFVRMKYIKQKNSAHPLKYLLLFGDGSCQNKSNPPGNPNFIPTYQSENSNVIISSFTSDDFYGLLDDSEGEDVGSVDIGIGRLPVSDTSQAGVIISKISSYMDPGNRGDWKNVVCLIADDEDGNTHLSDAEKLSKVLADSVPWINTTKIYFDAFRETTTSTGQFYPDVTRAITERVNSGALIVNYTGHGNENSLAHERVVTSETITQWKNKEKLPLFITATCEFSRFDNIEINPVNQEITEVSSAGEKILLSRSGGGIALMSTARLVYSAPNLELNRHIFEYAFTREQDGGAHRLGDIIKYAKNNSGNNINRRNFVLLGDPALRLAWPWHGTIVTDSINKKPVNSVADTINALSSVTISGHAEDYHGRIMNSFDGEVLPTVFGKPVIVQTRANDGGEKTEFKVRNNVLYSGKTSSSNGRFRFEFIVPRDIDYDFGYGKISYYGSDVTADLTGFYTNIIVGGFNNSAGSDTSGPGIKLYLNDTLFRNGGICDPSPRLLAFIEDKDGINTAGTGIGHDLVCWIDNDRGNYYVLNNYFKNDPGTFGKGSLIFPFSGLDGGKHTITLKAWDNFNNSSEKTISFYVVDGNVFVLKNLINYPNPFTGQTSITAEHNRPDESFTLIITISDISGRIIRIIRESSVSEGFRLYPVIWDGNDNYGKKVAAGVYPYRLSVITGNHETATISGRMIIL